MFLFVEEPYSLALRAKRAYRIESPWALRYTLVYSGLQFFLNIKAPKTNTSRGSRKRSFHSYRFGEIPGLIDIGTFLQGDVVGKQLQGNSVKDRAEQSCMFGETDNMDAFALLNV
ncbi:hypothetical protein SAMN05216299_10282 [Nitrosospira sp. Nsp14]|nr:hypothetical protein SAMN05216299_10282 [Nitrosospira sp. Nsp14]